MLPTFLPIDTCHVHSYLVYSIQVVKPILFIEFPDVQGGVLQKHISTEVPSHYFVGPPLNLVIIAFASPPIPLSPLPPHHPPTKNPE